MKKKKQKKVIYTKPKFVVLGNGKDIILGHQGVNTEWDNLGNTKPCAGCTS